ncbi:hypothetical protein AAHA92_13719 [Salvia divinorum]|uniref:Uncharacterized protein n=1 Tax=Salvia divinorum TaxID=28513 RepID=A0ABD1H989_SALDI
MALTFLHLGIFLMLANVVEITCNDVMPTIHLISEVTYPTPTRGEGKEAQYILATVYSELRDIKNTGIQTDIYWKVDDAGVSLSYDGINYGPKLPWLA